MARVRLINRDQAPLLARPHYHEGDPGSTGAALAQVRELDATLPFLSGVYELGTEARTKEPGAAALGGFVRHRPGHCS
jgi:hypothetical protein